MVPIFWQPLNGQVVQRISGYKFKNIQIEIRLGTWNIGNLCCRGTEVAEELRKRKVDICGLQEVQWRGQGAHFIGVERRRYRLWWSGNKAGKSGVEILVKEELCESVVEIRRMSDRMTTMRFIFME